MSETEVHPATVRGSTPAEGKVHFAWLDLRSCPADQRHAYVEAALHHGLAGIVADDPDLLAAVPPSLTRVVFAPDATATGPATSADLVIVPAVRAAASAAGVGTLVEVVDAASLDVGCTLAATTAWTVLHFADPTKIPLEIVIAAANNSTGRTVTIVGDLGEAEVVLGCLERGSDGVMMAPARLSDVAALAALLLPHEQPLELVELTVRGITHAGMGDRACLDTSSLLAEDEGLLVGSFASALVLTCSETHPLPYMPTRPFRVNAAGVHSYVLSSPTRTNYLSELSAGKQLLAVRVDGSARRVTLGRVKIERRPILSIDLVAPDGTSANIVVQDDWHVRLLGPKGSVHNVTALVPGDVLLGYLPGAARHVGWPVDEFCSER